jgi:hypothetical protein
MSNYVKHPDGTLGDSPELVADRIQRYLKGLNLGFEAEGGVPTLTSTPLFDVIDGHQTVRVWYRPHADEEMRLDTSTLCLYAHLRTALIQVAMKTAGHYPPSVVLRDPLMLLNDLFNDDEAPKLMRSDVLVIVAADFPHYAAAQQHIGSLLRMRQGMNLCSILAQPTSYELLNRSGKVLDKEFVDFMRDTRLVGNIELREADIPGLIRKLNGADIPGYVQKKKKQRPADG